MKKYVFLPILTGALFCSCGNEKKTSPLKEGGWKGVLTLNDSTGLVLPFRFDFEFSNDSSRITIHNAEEKIRVDEINISGDSIFIRMPVFDSEFRCKLSGDTMFSGSWVNYSRKDRNVIPFTATYGDSDIYGCPVYDNVFDFKGRWRCLFSPNEPDSSFAVGIFNPSGGHATGTFLTETGDYRYLEGCAFGKYMLLYCFDGSHAFAFHAEVMEDSMIWGEFYSGIHHQETWLAWKDESFRLRNADSLTYLKPGFPKVNFSFQNILDGSKVSLSDEKYRNKVTILQIMGSWCPNCMDETQFLTGLHNKYRSQGLEVVALAFEKAEDQDKAVNNIQRLKKKYNSQYDFLNTGFPPKAADDALPMLNHVMSFPTTLFIDRMGNVRKIRTGYSGPATGNEHELFVREITGFVEQLLAEK